MDSELLTYLNEKGKIANLTSYVFNKYQDCKNYNFLLNSLMSQTERVATHTLNQVSPLVNKTLNLSARVMEPAIGKVENPGLTLFIPIIELESSFILLIYLFI